MARGAHDVAGQGEGRDQGTEAELAELGHPWGCARRGDHRGISAFLREGDQVFHTYSTFARGLEQQGGTSAYLDLTALGPDLRFHDEY